MKKLVYIYFFFNSFFYCFSQTRPNAISGLQLWLKADSNVVFSGSTVSFWGDCSGNGNDAKQTIATYQPLFIPNSINNNPVLRFDGIDDFFDIPAITISDPNTIYLVGKKNCAGSLVEFGNSVTNYIYAINNFTDDMTYINLGNWIAWNIGNLNKVTILNTIYSNSKIELFVNGNSQGSQGYSSQNIVNTIAMNQPSNYSCADFAEIIYYNRALSILERQNVEKYLFNKYANQVHLGKSILLKTSFCDTTLHAGNGFSSYKWNTGAITESILVGQGMYSVTVTDINGFTSQDSISVSYPKLAIKDTLICLGTNVLLDPNLNTAYTYKWSTGQTTPTITVNTAQKYWVSISDKSGCSLNSDTITVSIDNFANTIHLGSDTTLCSGNFIGLKNSGSLSSGLTYQWSTTETSPEIAITTSGNYSVTVTDKNNCVGNDIQYVTVSGTAPTPNFTVTNGCVGDLIQFTNSSTPVGDAWKWDFGNSNGSTDQNPSQNYAAGGTFPVTLTVWSGSCNKTLKQDITIHSKPALPILLAPINNFSESDSIATFTWNSSGTADYCVLEIASNQQFSSIVYTSGKITTDTLQYTFPTQYTKLYWRITAYNGCGKTMSLINTITFFYASTISNMILWLKPDVGVNSTTNLVSQWNDQSGNSDNCSQVDVTKQALIEPNALNGIPVINFDGVNDNYSLQDTISLSGDFSYFMVFKTKNATSNGFGLANTKDQSVSFINYINGNSYTETTKNTINFTTGMLTQYSIISVVRSNNVVSMYKNGKSLGTSQSLQGIINLNILGNSHWGYTNAKIAEIITFNKAVSDIEKQEIESYLKTKYAPKPVDLGTDITITQSLCDTIIHAGKGYAQYIWTTGDTTESIKVTKSGYYSVDVVDSVFGFQSSSGIFITFNVEPKLISDTTICPGSTLTWDTKLNNTDFTYKWNTGEITPSITISKAGNYLVTVSDNFGCSFTTDTAKITIDNFNTSIDLGKDTSLCQYNELELQKGGERAVLFAWSDGSTNKTLSLQATGTYYLTATDIYSCKADDSIKVTMSGMAPDTKFTIEGNCEHDSVMFTDNSVSRNSSKIIAWKWIVQNDTITEQNIKYRFANPGNYYIKLVIQTDGLCSGNKTIPWEIDPKPVASFTPLSFCEFSQIPFINKSSIVSGLMLHNTWLINDTIIHDKDTITLVFHNFGKQLAKFMVTSDKNCIDTFADSVEAKSSPKAVFTVSPSCNKNPYYLFDKSIVPPYNGILSSTWNINGFKKDQISPYTPDSSSLADTVMLTVKGIDGCSDSVKQIVAFSPIPKAAMQFKNVCMGDSAHFYDRSTISSGTITNWKWDIGDSIEMFVQNPTVEFKQSKTYQIVLQIISDMGCGDTVYSSLKTIKKPVAHFDFEPKIVGAPIDITFSNRSDSATSYKWDFGDNEFSTDFAPVHEYVDSGTFVITLFAYNDYLCADSTQKTFQLPKSNYSLVQSSIILTQKNGYLTVSTVFGNTGLNPITSIDFILKKDDGTWIKENWKGSLTTGIVDTFTFASTFKELNDALPKYICIDANALSKIDSIVATGHLCVTQTTDLESYAVYPVPADDKITITFATAIKGNVEYSIYDNMGKPAIQGSKSVDEGFNALTIPTSNLMQGFYVWRIMLGGKAKEGTFVVQRK